MTLLIKIMLGLVFGSLQKCRVYSSVKLPSPQEIESRLMNVIGSFSKVQGKKVRLDCSLTL
jgi:hypothetical protein